MGMNGDEVYKGAMLLHKLKRVGGKEALFEYCAKKHRRCDIEEKLRVTLYYCIHGEQATSIRYGKSRSYGGNCYDRVMGYVDEMLEARRDTE